MLRKITINGAKFSAPMGKHAQLFERYSPIGSSHVIAGAQSTEEHMDRATHTRRTPMKDPKKFIDADLLSSIYILADAVDYSSSCVRCLCAIVERTFPTISDTFLPLNAAHRELAPWHVLKLPTTANVALTAALLVAMDWPDVYDSHDIRHPHDGRSSSDWNSSAEE